MCRLQVFACGLNNYGQLGVGDRENRTEPTLVPKLSNVGIVDIAAGEHHTIALTNIGTVYVMGRGDQGQLGVLGNGNERIPVGQCLEEPVVMPPRRFAGEGP
jgi:alpha-tubulin suppressor-like RCC1 family protein